jgi:hypothetical protein
MTDQHYAPVAQLDRASGYEPEGREFESLRARQISFSLRCLALVRASMRPTGSSSDVSADQPARNALTTALGSSSMIFNRVLAAPVGERLPCSHFRSVDALTPKASAN